MPLAPWLPREISPLDPNTIRLLNPLIARRYSGRIFAPDPLSAEEVDSLLYAVQWAPSCANRQPWHVVCAHSPEGLDRARRCLRPGNRWAAAAPLMLVIAGRTQDAHVSADGCEYLLFDLGLATQNLLL
ncbi:MAG TPA: nitroreductase family protein, partial [Limnochordia bacterium]